MPRKITANSKMENKSVVLHKKLRELETELAHIIRIPVDPASPPDPLRKIASDDIRRRFAFLDNLLSQEIASQPQSSSQLDGIGESLAALRSICSECTQGLLVRGGFSESENFPGGRSPESIRSDSEEGGGSEGEGRAQLVPYGGGGGGGSSSDSISYPRDFPPEEAVEELFGGAEEDAAVRKEKEAAAEEKVWRRVGKYGGVFGCGVIVGAICVMEWFFAAIAPQLMEYEALHLPPT